MNERANTSRWIEEILTGDRSLEDPDVIRWLDGNPQARAELEDAQDLTRLLDDAGREQRETLGDSREAREAPGHDRVAPRLEELIRDEAPARGGSVATTSSLGHPVRPRRLAPILAAAALLIAAPLLWWSLGAEPEPGSPRDDVFLGDEAFAPRFERDATTGASTLLWSYELAPAGWFEVVLRDAADSPDAPPLARVGRYTGSSWTPEEDLPERVSVHITAFGPAGEVEDSWSGVLGASDE